MHPPQPNEVTQKKSLCKVQSILCNYCDLVPHLWMKDPDKKNDNYGRIKKKNLEKRVEILKTVIPYVNETKRFKHHFDVQCKWKKEMLNIQNEDNFERKKP